MNRTKFGLMATVIAGLAMQAPTGVGISLGLTFLPDLAQAQSVKNSAGKKKLVKKSTLPKPYVSKALRAVLMPVTKEVAKKFKLAKGAKGVMVVSVQPDGLGKLAGIKPGDVISSLLGYAVKKPSDVDTIVAYLLQQGTTDYQIGGIRKNGKKYAAATYIYPDYFWAPFDVYTVSSWTSFSYDTYSYTEYYSYYSETIYTSYSRSETYISETITSESFYSETISTEYSYDYSSYEEQIVEGSYVAGGEGEVWAEDVSEVYYYPAEDPVELEVPFDEAAAGDADAFTADPGDADYEAVDEEEVALLAEEETLYAEDSAMDDVVDDTAAEDTGEFVDDAAVEDTGEFVDDTATEDTGEYVDDGSGMVEDTGEYVDDGSGMVEDTGEYVDPGPECPDGTYLGDDGSCTSGETYEDTGAYEDPGAYEAPAEEFYEAPVEEVYEAPAEEFYEAPVEESYDSSGDGGYVDDGGGDTGYIEEY